MTIQEPYSINLNIQNTSLGYIDIQKFVDARADSNKVWCE